MSLYLLQIDFPYSGPWNREMVTAFEVVARSISAEPGLRWKLWTENEENQEAGGIYLFNNAEDALSYARRHSARLADAGIMDLDCKFFRVNKTLSRINSAPLQVSPLDNNEPETPRMYLVQTDFSHQGPWGEEMASAYEQLAHYFTHEAGLMWKIWTENQETKEAGGLFIFSDEANAHRFLEEHKVRLADGNFQRASCKLFSINGELSGMSLPGR